MLLNSNSVGHLNELSPDLRKKLEERVRSFGKTVRYKFDLAKQNPDPTKYNGDTVWPNIYTLDPTVFNISDPFENREGWSKSKRIALIDGVDDKGMPNKFRKIRVEGRFKGVYYLSTESNDEHFQIAMMLELHPKNKNGMFPDPTKHQVFERVDETAYAAERREKRTAKTKALNAAEEMSDAQIKSFADAMMWDSTEPVSLLRDKVEELAETDPVYFNDLVEGKTVEYRAAVQKALNNKLISYDPAENKFLWTSNQHTIVTLAFIDGKNHVEQFADWLQTGGSKSDEVYSRLKGLGKEKPVAG